MPIRKELSIKDLEALSGIKAHTIRVWEQRYQIITPKRTPTNIRTYTNEDLRTILIISLLTRHGSKISRVAKMSPEERNTQVEQVFHDASDFAPYIESLTLAMIELNEARFEKVISRCTIQYGFEKMMENIIYPFLEKTGVMWMTNTIHPAQEHFMSNLIRQKLIVAIDGLPLSHKMDAERFILFLPMREIHELSLLYLNYLLRQHGKQVIYLGTNIPTEDLLEICHQYGPSRLITVVSVFPAGANLVKYLNDLSDQVSPTQLIAGGIGVRKIATELNKSIRVISSLGEVHELIQRG